jgi:hypothetical protein
MTHEIQIECVMIQYTHETERTNFRCKCRRSADLTTGRSEVDDFDFVGVLRNSRRSKCVLQQTKLAHTSFGAIGAFELRWDEGW